ncbi:MAG: threonine synthase [Gammaproteobacteria bacterium]|nr:threonine synthase [Gammaproteobacteria bacterium]
MKFISSEKKSSSLTLSQAIHQGLADDGGLFIPQTFPQRLATWQDHYSDLVNNCLEDYFADDPLQSHLHAICQRSYNFQPQCLQLDDKLFLLNLYEGPTLSFKDFGAQFLAQAMTAIAQAKQQLILVATSGDTGSAVAAAFHNKPGVSVIILYPDGMVSQRQAHQLSCWGDNVTTLRVQGDFDVCQALVKQAFSDETLQQNYALSTANSINIGRLLPQIAYYAYASLWYATSHEEPLSFIIPSGNIGNATACFWAREMGYPIKDIMLAQNRNSAVYDYWHSGVYTPRSTQATIANAMDVGNPSNFRRLQSLYPDYQLFKRCVMVDRIDDEEIKRAVSDCYQRYQQFICPHTAAAYAAYQRAPHAGSWMVVATAHAAKFDNVLAPLLPSEIPLPENFRQQLALPAETHPVQPDLSEIKKFIEKR